MNQRWLFGRDSYRPPQEVIRTSEYDVAPIEYAVAREFVEAHHYARSYPADRWRFGLFRRGRLVGAAVFSVPMHAKVITNSLGIDDPNDGVELGRFVLLDEVPGNGETWFLSRAFASLPRGLAGVVAFSDPVPRKNWYGITIKPGHRGTIYCAFSAIYQGRATPRTHRLLPDGTVASPRTLQKIRAGERGCRGAERDLEAVLGPRGRGETVTQWVSRICPTFRHPGNHRYVFPLWHSVRRAMPASLPYPV